MDQQQNTNMPAKTPETKDQKNNIDTDSIFQFISEIFKKAFNTFQKSNLTMPLIIAGIVSWIIAFLPNLASFNGSLIIILAFISMIASIVYGFSLANIALQASKGNIPTVEDAKKTIPRTIEYIIGGIKIFINFIIKLFKPPFIIPGFKYAIGSGFFVYENLENETQIDKAMEKSREMTKGNILNIFCLAIALALLNIVAGFIPFFLGTIFMAPFSALCAAHMYQKFKN